MTFLVIKYTDRITQLGAMSIETALASAGNMIGFSILIISLSLLIIAAIDVPYVLYDYYKKLKMTKKEVKDEMKDTEGRPEVKSHIRKRQREMASARMIEKVKDADVVITNPEHFSVAVSYEPSGENAPIVVAKGIDHLALRIRERAENNSIFLFEAPVLSRALYFTTDINQQIPEQLYVAVAQVIAYVYNLNAVDKISSTPEKPFPQVPPELTFDSFGNVSN
jgi:flagellar biosynthetic protein FlhB